MAHHHHHAAGEPHHHHAGGGEHHQHPPGAGGAEPPTPALFFKNIWGYINTAALRGAIDLDLFSAVQEVGPNATVAKVAEKIKAPERGTRMLLDFLGVEGFFVKANGTYNNTPSSTMFLVKASPAYIGHAAEFLGSLETTQPFQDMAALIRQGTTPLPNGGTTAPDHQVWVKFARGMAGMSMGHAQMLVSFPDVMPPASSEPISVLDVAAGHGMYGISVANKFPNAKLTFLDWAAVLDVCKENVAKFHVAADRCEYIIGSAFEADLKGPYDVILLTNILHHFDFASNVKFVKRMVAALKPNGRIITLEFVPNEERTAPPTAVMFSLMMLGTTPAGDAYTFSQFDSMFKEAGASKNRLVSLPTGSSFIISTH